MSVSRCARDFLAADVLARAATCGDAEEAALLDLSLPLPEIVRLSGLLSGLLPVGELGLLPARPCIARSGRSHSVSWRSSPPVATFVPHGEKATHRTSCS